MVMISGFRRKEDANCALLGYYAILKTMLFCAGDKIEKNEMGWACGAYG